MEAVSEDIRRFLQVDSGYDSGYGNSYVYGYDPVYDFIYDSEFGCGFGFGDSCGCGFSCGNGEGDGFSCGCGFSCGNGNGSSYDDLCKLNGTPVYYIDDIPTLIYQVRGFVAKGAIVRNDLTLEDCWIVRCGNSFAHGDTLHNAYRDALEKELADMPEDERIDRFVAEHPDPDAEYGDLFQWHHILTGSCEFGRREWCRQHDLQPTDSITVRRFLKETASDYGGDIIRKVAERMQVDL